MYKKELQIGGRTLSIETGAVAHMQLNEEEQQNPPQRLLGQTDLEDELHLGGGQVDVAGQQVHALDGRRPDHLVDLGVPLHQAG